MTNQRTVRAGRLCAVAAIVATIAAAVLTLSMARPERWPLTVALVTALLWGLGGPVAVAVVPGSQISRSEHRRKAIRNAISDTIHRNASDMGQFSELAVSERDNPGSFRNGTLMNLGRVPDQVARITSAAAAAHGPVALIVPEGRDAPVGLDPSVFVVKVSNGEASPEIDEFYGLCDAVLVTSARAIPTAAMADAGARIARGASWVQGTVEALNDDRFGPLEREQLDTGLRRMASIAGLWCWEPDATIVETSLLRQHPMQFGRPLGAWLRERAADGATGLLVDEVLTRRAAPVAAEGYWPDTTARQSAWSADLSLAVTSKALGMRARAEALALLVRTLGAWSLFWWLAVLVLLQDGSPVHNGNLALVALVLVAMVLRWLAPRFATGLKPAPIADFTAGVYGLPGSLAGIFSAMTRRVSPARRSVSTRPLIWLALIGTGSAANVVLTAGPNSGAARVASGAAAALLVLTWIFTVRSLVERSWVRVGFRVPLQAQAEVVSGTAPIRAPKAAPNWRLVDGGTGGFALAGPSTGHEVGDEIAVEVVGQDGTEFTLHGTVAARRGHPQFEELLGVQLRTVEPATADWARFLIQSAGRLDSAQIPDGPHSEEEATIAVEAGNLALLGLSKRSRLGRLIDRLAIGLVLMVSIAVVFTIGLVLVGLRPLVIRSGSMVPTYHVGDVVLVSSQLASDISEGQVVTRFDAPEATDSLTHRVRHMSRSGDLLQIETRGDANDSSEYWDIQSQQRVGVVVASIPAVGRPLTSIRGSSGWTLAAILAVAAMVALLLRPRRVATPHVPQAELRGEGFLIPQRDAPTGSPTPPSGERK